MFYAIKLVIINQFILQFIYFSYFYFYMFISNTSYDKPAVRV